MPQIMQFAVTQLHTFTYSPQPIHCQYTMMLDTPGLRIFIHSLFSKLHLLPPKTVILHAQSPSVLQRHFQLKRVEFYNYDHENFLDG